MYASSIFTCVPLYLDKFFLKEGAVRFFQIRKIYGHVFPAGQFQVKKSKKLKYSKTDEIGQSKLIRIDKC